MTGLRPERGEEEEAYRRRKYLKIRCWIRTPKGTKMEKRVETLDGEKFCYRD